MVSQKICKKILALGIAFSSATTSMAEGTAQKVTKDEYCAAQRAPGAHVIDVHKRLDPFKDSQATVYLPSNHGTVRMDFNCRDLMLNCADRRFGFTEKLVAQAHSALGKNNRNDPKNIRQLSSQLLGRVDIVSTETPDSLHLSDHLEVVHGMGIVYEQYGEIKRYPAGKAITKACAQNLNM